MQLRHIRPRSVEWYDALDWEERHGHNGRERLSPEETLRLRTLVETEQAFEAWRASAAPADGRAAAASVDRRPS